MANVALSGLTELTSLAAADLMLVTDDSEAGAEQSKYIQLSTLRDYLMITGSYVRPQFTYKDADEIYVGGGFYDVDGKWSAWASQLTLDIGSPSASTWYYVYADYSAITSGTALTASEFIFSTTAPAWSESKKGFFNGSDRAVFAVLTDSSSNIKEFFHSGDTVIFADYISDRSASNSATSWEDVTLSIPACCRLGLVSFVMYGGANSNNFFYWRTNGQSGTTGHAIASSRKLSNGTAQYAINDATVMTDSNKKIEVKCISSSLSMGVYTNGFKLPVGM